MKETEVKLGNKTVSQKSEEKLSTGEVLVNFFDYAIKEAKTHKRGFASFAQDEKKLKS